MRSTAPVAPIATPTTRTKGLMTALQPIAGSEHSPMMKPGIAAARKPRSPQASESPRRSPSSVSNMRTIARTAVTAPTPNTAREAQKQLGASCPSCAPHGAAKVATPIRSSAASAVRIKPATGCAFGLRMASPFSLGCCFVVHRITRSPNSLQSHCEPLAFKSRRRIRVHTVRKIPMDKAPSGLQESLNQLLRTIAPIFGFKWLPIRWGRNPCLKPRFPNIAMNWHFATSWFSGPVERIALRLPINHFMLFFGVIASIL